MSTKLVRMGLALAVVLSMVLVFAAAAFAGGSGPTIDWWVFSGGGGRMSGSGVTLDGSLAQPITGVSTGGNTWLGAGYWTAELPWQTFLPLLER